MLGHGWNQVLITFHPGFPEVFPDLALPISRLLRSEDREPQETRTLRLRVLRGYPTVRWRAGHEISTPNSPSQGLRRVPEISVCGTDYAAHSDCEE